MSKLDGGAVTNEKRERGWLAVTAAVNAVSPFHCIRTVEEVKKKWTCLKSDVKRKRVDASVKCRITVIYSNIALFMVEMQ